MIRGYRTLDEAVKNQIEERKLTSQQKESAWQEKEPVYAEYEALHPGVVDDIASLDCYRVFWRDWIVSCPAWRSDRVDNLEMGKYRCGAMAILVHKDDEGSLIFCPECLYAGELFAT